MKVEVLVVTPGAEELIEQAGRTCYQSQDKIAEESREPFIKRLIKAGHISVLEHASVTFRLKEVSRAFTHQLVRHRVCSYSQQSQRYVREDKFSYVVPPKVAKSNEAEEVFKDCMDKIRESYKKLLDLGIPKEDSRYVLPNSCQTEIVFSCNFRQLRHMLELRGELSAQWEIREVFIEILKEMKKIAPVCFCDFLVNEEKRTIFKEE
jgi:thymidylate synthase (FAD)